MGSTLYNAVKQSLIVEAAAVQSIQQWTDAAVAVVGSPEISAAILDVPDEVPQIDPNTAFFAGDLSKWAFKASKPAKHGVLDLSKNPPVYVPGPGFPNSDEYSVKICHQKFANICSNEYSKITLRPTAPTTTTISIPTNGFYANTQAACSSSAVAPLNVDFKFYVILPNQSETTTLTTLINETTFLNSGLPADAQVWCESQVIGEYGLRSPAMQSSKVIVPNAAPTHTPPNVVEHALFEDASINIGLGLAQENDSDPVRWIIENLPVKGLLSVPADYQTAPASQTLAYTAKPDSNGADFFIYKVCDNRPTPACSPLRRIDVNIAPVNDAPVVSAISTQQTYEDTPLVVAFAFNDVDNTLTCSSAHLTYQSSNPAVLSTSGRITWGGTWPNCIATISPNYDAFGSTNLTFTGTNGNLEAAQTFPLNVMPINDNPVLAAVSNKTTAEDTPLQIPFTISDVDNEVDCSSSVSIQFTNESLFTATGLSLSGTAPDCVLTAAPILNANGNSDITMTLADGVGGSAQRNFNLQVTAVNDAPEMNQLTALSTAEDTPIVGLEILISDVDGPLSCATSLALHSSKPNLLDSTGFSLNDQGDKCVFEISPKPNKSGSTQITFTLTDAAGYPVSQTVPLTVLAINDAPDEVLLTNNQIAEYLPAGTLVGALSTLDNDPIDSFTYSVSGDVSYSFEIQDQTLVTSEIFDFESKPSYTFSIISTDSANQSVSRSVTINIVNVPDAPKNLTLSTSTINENVAIGSIVGQFSASDQDANTTLTYSIEGDDAVYFEVDGTALKTSAPMNFEDKRLFN